MNNKVVDNVFDLVGNTPIIRLKNLSKEYGCNIYAKCEFFNPGHSIKDRIALPLVLDAEKRGLLKPGYTIVEATAGNTGFGLAMVCAQRGYKLKLIVTSKASKDKVKMLEACGAEVIVVEYSNSSAKPGAFIEYARELAKNLPNAWYVDQFYNQVNAKIHYETTAREIWQQLDSKIDAFVAGIGTGGSFCGVSKYLKEQNKNIQCILADPVGSIQYDAYYKKNTNASKYLTEGIGGDFITGITDLDLADEVIQVKDQETMHSCFEVFKKESLFVGASSGTIIAATKKYCVNVPKNSNIVILLPDSGKHYLSTFYDKKWCEANGLLE